MCRTLFLATKFASTTQTTSVKWPPSSDGAAATSWRHRNSRLSGSDAPAALWLRGEGGSSLWRTQATGSVRTFRRLGSNHPWGVRRRTTKEVGRLVAAPWRHRNRRPLAPAERPPCLSAASKAAECRARYSHHHVRVWPYVTCSRHPCAIEQLIASLYTNDAYAHVIILLSDIHIFMLCNFTSFGLTLNIFTPTKVQSSLYIYIYMYGDVHPHLFFVQLTPLFRDNFSFPEHFVANPATNVAKRREGHSAEMHTKRTYKSVEKKQKKTHCLRVQMLAELSIYIL